MLALQTPPPGSVLHASSSTCFCPAGTVKLSVCPTCVPPGHIILTVSASREQGTGRGSGIKGAERWWRSLARLMDMYRMNRDIHQQQPRACSSTQVLRRLLHLAIINDILTRAGCRARCQLGAVGCRQQKHRGNATQSNTVTCCANSVQPRTWHLGRPLPGGCWSCLNNSAAGCTHGVRSQWHSGLD